MARFLVEAYVPRESRDDLTEAVRRTRQVAREMTDAGAPVNHLRSIFVPGDETCFHLFESPSIEAVEDVCGHAQLTFDRISEALEPIPDAGGAR